LLLALLLLPLLLPLLPLLPLLLLVLVLLLLVHRVDEELVPGPHTPASFCAAAAAVAMAVAALAAAQGWEQEGYDGLTVKRMQVLNTGLHDKHHSVLPLLLLLLVPRVDEDEYGGLTEFVFEGMMGSFASFMVRYGLLDGNLYALAVHCIC
jgi:hypothetical protein